jgi:hypothetical protein
MPFPKVKSHELASRFNCEASWQFDSDCFPMTIQKPITLQDGSEIESRDILCSLYARCALA